MRFFRTLHFLSVDVVLGALLFQCLLTTIFLPSQLPPIHVSVALAFVVWTIYLVDRLIDNQKPIHNSALHDFHSRHSFAIKCLIFGNILILFTIIIYLPKYIIINGVLIGFLVLVYWVFLIFGFFERIKFIKEISTAIIYTLGVSLYVCLNIGDSNLVKIQLIIGLLFLLALQNLVLFTLISNSGLRKDLMLRCVEGIFICLWLAILFFTQLSVSLLLPFLLTFVINLWIHYISGGKQWAWLGEIAFLSPLFYYLYAIIST